MALSELYCLTKRLEGVHRMDPVSFGLLLASFAIMQSPFNLQLRFSCRRAHRKRFDGDDGDEDGGGMGRASFNRFSCLDPGVGNSYSIPGRGNCGEGEVWNGRPGPNYAMLRS